MLNKEQIKQNRFSYVPDEWEIIRIKEVVEKASQRDPSKTPFERFKYVDISSISNELFWIAGSQDLTGKEAPSRARKEIKTNDIIYATVRPYLKRIAIVPKEFDREICSTGFCSPNLFAWEISLSMKLIRF